MSKTFVRFSGNVKDGTHTSPAKPTIWHPGIYKGHNPKYPCDDPLLNKVMVGDHIYQYVGTMREVPRPKIKKAKPFVVGQVYLIESNPSRRGRRFAGYFGDEALWHQESGNSGYYRTSKDGRAVQKGLISFVPEYEEVDDGFEYHLVDES